MKLVIIGGGPAGLLAAISAASNHENIEILILEKNSMLGKKLLITGKGRCNITNNINISEFINNIPGNGKFLYSAFKNFNNLDIIRLLNTQGVETKVERGNRIFPKSDKSKDVLDALIKKVKQLNVSIKIDSKVSKILERENIVKGVILESGEKIYADKVIIATGGNTYKATGSTGDGYILAKNLGHSITNIKPSLVPLEVKEKAECIKMQGLSLKNVSIKLVDVEKNKIIYEDFGEMIFTHFGVSGPIILSSSAYLVRYKDIDKLMRENKIKLYVDLKPALSEEKLDKRLIRDFEENKNKQFKHSLNKLLPNKIIEYIIQKSNIDPTRKVNEIKKNERNKLVKLIKNIEVTIKDFRPLDEGIITSGGINIKEINSSTMESKIVKGLYFAGEIIDVDAYTGGFNLQIAYSTGYTAGMLK